MKTSQEKVKKEYNEFATKYAIANAHALPQYQLLEFCSFLPKEKSRIRILDAGCGIGRDVEYLLEDGYDILGIDFSPEMIRVAKKLVPKGKFEVGDMREIEFKKNTFNGIWCNASLLHLPKKETKNVITKFLQWLKPQGILYVSMLEGDGFKYTIIKRFYQNPLPVYYYNLNELIQMLEETGFEIIKYRNEYDFENLWIDVFCRKPL